PPLPAVPPVAPAVPPPPPLPAVLPALPPVAPAVPPLPDEPLAPPFPDEPALPPRPPVPPVFGSSPQPHTAAVAPTIISTGTSLALSIPEPTSAPSRPTSSVVALLVRASCAFAQPICTRRSSASPRFPTA